MGKNIYKRMHIYVYILCTLGFPGGLDAKEFACNAGGLGSVPGLGGSLAEEYGNPLQYSCLENPMDRGAWWATVHGVTTRQTRLSDSHFHCVYHFAVQQ